MTQRDRKIAEYKAEISVLRRKRSEDFARIGYLKFVLRESYGVEG